MASYSRFQKQPYSKAFDLPGFAARSDILIQSGKRKKKYAADSFQGYPRCTNGSHPSSLFWDIAVDSTSASYPRSTIIKHGECDDE